MYSPIRTLSMLLVGLFVATIATEPQARNNPAVGQQTFDYEILREGKPVGSHRVTVQRGDGRTRVLSNSNIEVGLLGLTFYRFQYESEEEWDDRGLRRLLVSVNDDGEQMELSGKRDGGRFVWRIGDSKPMVQQMPVYPTNHWNSSVLSQSRVLNTLTGNINRVSIQKERPARGERPQVQRFRYTGDLNLDAWYDDSGRWLGMRFQGRDDSTIEYRCRDCTAWWTL